ncbi:MAG: OmpA family protein [Bacteroidota bacterium]
MKYLLITLLSLFFFTAEAQRSPRNTDSNQCYVRCISLNEYDVWYEDHLTYTEEESLLYPHEEIEFILSPERHGWEYVDCRNCPTDNPEDHQILCYKTFPEVVHIIYSPLDSNLGNPFFVELEFRSLIKEGGLASWEEIDCELVRYNALPIYYEGKHTHLYDTEYEIIDEVLLTLLNDRPNLRIEIAAFTDSRGSSEDNFELTQERANGVSDYLVSRGINPERLVARGYGETRLTNGCADGVVCSERKHEENNRIVFRVMSVGQ